MPLQEALINDCILIVNENLNAKAKLLYERNTNSPLFLKVADSYLKRNEVQKAILIIEEGLKIFPEHPVAFILLGKANYLLNKIDAADSFIKQASELLDSNRTYTHYKKELKLPNKPVSPFDSSRGNIFINSFADDLTSKDNQKLDENFQSIDERLTELAEEVMKAKIERNENFSIPESDQEKISPDKSKLASETLANIYLTQGEKNEAIKIYELLIHRNPERKEYYLGKISEISSR